MLNKENFFKEMSHSDVWLEEKQHIYIHKETKVRYSSVTTILSMIKDKFDPSIKKNIVKQYVRFISQIENLGLAYKQDPELFNWIITTYQTHKGKLPQKTKRWGSKTYQSPKSFKEFNSIEELVATLKDLERLNPNVRKKTTYLKYDGNPMTEEEMSRLWIAITDIANVFGTLIHEICEEHILLKQGFLFTNVITKRIEQGYEKTKELFKEYMSEILFKNTNYVFDEYQMSFSLNDLKRKIVNEFEKLKWNLGYVCIPEKILHLESKQLCGSSDVFINYCPIKFSVNDHKTNKEFTTKSKYGLRYKKPFDHLEVCDLNTYTLQMSIYSLMEELEKDRKHESSEISYFSRKDYTFEGIPIKYEKDYAMKLLDMYDNKLKKLWETMGHKDIFNNVPKKYMNNLMFRIDSLIKEHKMANFYDGKSFKEIKSAYQNYVNDYVTTNLKIDNHV